MADLTLIEELRAHLIANGLVRDPDVPGAAAACHLQPRNGMPEPAVGAVVAALVPGAQIPALQRHVDAYLEQRLVDVIVRARTGADAELLHRQIRRLIAEQRGVMFGALRVEWCALWTGDQPTGSTDTYYERTQTFRIGARVKALAGEPLTP
jgi:hypothetical protein